MIEQAWRKTLKGVEATFTAGWSIGEIAYAARHPHRVAGDPFREAVAEDIDKFGLYKAFPDEVQRVELRRGGWAALPNPYERVGQGGGDKIVAQLRGGQPRHRRAIVVCHCYGLPFPTWMERLFGLHRLEGFDVFYNIMNHHYRGSFGFWPGFGLASPQMSRMIENVRSAFTGLRSLVRSLEHTFGYDEVILLGYSIGGHISMHVANSHPVSRLALYCPVTSLRATATELGLMPLASPFVDRALGRLQRDFDFADLDVLDPLQHDLKPPVDDLLFILQTHDAMVPTRQSDALRRRYPDVRCHEYPGTHAFPVEQRAMQRTLHAWLTRA